MDEKGVLRVLTTKAFRLELEDKLLRILSHHIDKDLAVTGAVTIFQIFRVGRVEIDEAKAGEASEE